MEPSLNPPLKRRSHTWRIYWSVHTDEVCACPSCNCHSWRNLFCAHTKNKQKKVFEKLLWFSQLDSFTEKQHAHMLNLRAHSAGRTSYADTKNPKHNAFACGRQKGGPTRSCVQLLFRERKNKVTSARWVATYFSQTQKPLDPTKLKTAQHKPTKKQKLKTSTEKTSRRTASLTHSVFFLLRWVSRNGRVRHGPHPFQLWRIHFT